MQGCLLLLAVVLPMVQGFRVESQISSLQLVTGAGAAVRPKTDMTFVCEETDFGVTQRKFLTLSNGTLVPMIIQCSRPVYVATKTLVGYVFRDGRLQLIRACNFRDAASAAVTANSSLFTQSVVSGTSLQNLPSHHPILQGRLAVEDIHSHYQSGAAGSLGDNDPHGQVMLWNTQKRMQAIRRDPFKTPRPVYKLQSSVGFGLACGVAALFPVVGSGTCFGYLNSRIDSVEESLGNLRQTYQQEYGVLARKLEAESQLQQLLADRLDTQALMLNQSFLIAQANTQATQKLALQADMAINASLMFEASATSAMNTFRSQLSTIASSQVTLANRVIALAGSIGPDNAELQERMNNVTRAINAQLQVFAQNLSTALAVQYRQYWALTTALQKLKGYVEELAYRNRFRREISYLAHSVIDAVEAAGVYKPFLDDAGARPNLNSPFAVRALLDRTYIKAPVGSGSVTATFHQFDFYCATTRLMDPELSFMTVGGFLTNMGPPNCLLSVTTSNNCSCWIAMTKSTCTTSAAKVGKADWYTRVIPNATADCTGSLTVQTTVNYKSAGDFLAYAKTMCLASTYNTLPYVVGSAINYILRNVTSSLSYCSDNMADALVGTGVSTFDDFLSVMMGYMTDAFKVTRQNIDLYDQILYGGFPNKMTAYNEPFVRRTAQLGECQYHAFMSYSTDMLPVYRLDFDTDPVYTVSINIPGFVNANVSQTTMYDPHNSLLLQSGYQVVVGNPTDPATIYDIPVSMLPLTDVAGARASMVTYHLCPYNNYRLCNITSFLQRTGRDFDHFAGANVPEYNRMSIDGNGRCIGARRLSAGGQCALRDDYKVFAVGSNVGFSPTSGATVRATVTVPESTLTDILFTNCPSLEVEDTSANGKTVVLTNTFATDTTNTLIVTGNCARTYTGVVTPARGTFRLFVKACAGGGTANVALFRLNSDLSLTQCSQNRTVSLDRNAYLALQSNADVLFVNTSSVESLDRSMLSSNAMDMKTLQTQAKTFTGLVLALADLGLVQPGSASFRYLNSSLTDLIAARDAVLNVSVAIRNSASLTLGNSDYIAQMRALIASAQADIDSTVAPAQAFLKAQAKDGALAVNQSTLNRLINNLSRELLNIKYAQAYTAISLGPSLGDFFDIIGDGAKAVGNGLVSAASAAANFVKNVVNDVLGIAKSLFTGLGGIFVFIITIIGAAAGVAAFCLTLFFNRQLKQRMATLEERMNIMQGIHPAPAAAPPAAAVQMMAYAPAPATKTDTKPLLVQAAPQPVFAQAPAPVLAGPTFVETWR